MRGSIYWRAVLVLSVATACLVFSAASANGELLVYEPFDYGDDWLRGQGGALGTTGTWVSNDTGCTDGWRVHPEGELTGIAVSPGYDANNPSAPGILNTFDGTVYNLPTMGGFVGTPGPQDRTPALPYGTDGCTGNLDASIGLDPSVTATFQSGTTTWFSYVGAIAWDRNAGAPTFMISTDPTTDGQRGLTMENAGEGIGGVGGPQRYNLYDVYPHYFRDGQHNQTPGGYLGGVFGDHDGIVTKFESNSTDDGVLDESGQTRTHTMAWHGSDADGFGAANIIIGKIEWDADTGGYDIITVVRFLETDVIDEAAFDDLVADLPALSSANWQVAVTPADPNNPSNKPDLDQSEFATLNISSLKFFVDELRLGTTFDDIIGISGPVVVPGDADGNGVVNAADYIALKTHMGKANNADLADGDVDDDGDVDWADLQLLQAHYGETSADASPAVPEPATLGLLALGAVAILRRRRA